MSALPRLAVLVGSARIGGNGAGIAQWVSTLLDRRLNASSRTVEVVTVSPSTPPRPLGPVTDGSKTPAQVKDPSAYTSEIVREWSKFVSSSAAFAIVTPEYNGGYPGELKNALDNVYNEWADKPVIVVTYGGGGGQRVATALQPVLSTLKLDVVDGPRIVLPRAYTGGPDRVIPGATYPEFLKAYEDAVYNAADTISNKLGESEVPCCPHEHFHSSDSPALTPFWSLTVKGQ